MAIQEIQMTKEAFVHECNKTVQDWGAIVAGGGDPAKTRILVTIDHHILITKSTLSVLGPCMHFVGKGQITFDHCPNLKSVEAHFHVPVAFRQCGITNTKGMHTHPKEEQESSKANHPQIRFIGCLDLEVAEGVWHGGVGYRGCGVKKVDPSFRSMGPTEFENCPFLEVLEGTIEGSLTATGCQVLRSTKNVRVLGTNAEGLCADLSQNPKLEKAEGFFQGYVNWSASSITGIGDLVTGTSPAGWSASFLRCKDMKTANGTFPAAVDFSQSGLETTAGLKITGSSYEGIAALFQGCKGLKRVEGEFEGMADYRESMVEGFGGPSELSIPKFLSNPKNTEGPKVWLNLEHCPNLAEKHLPQRLANLGADTVRADSQLWERTKTRSKLRQELAQSRERASGASLGI
jgi:hypothetical protein